MALGPGSIAFVGLNTDLNDNLSFVALETIPSGTTIYFQDNEWTGAAFNTGESAFQLTLSADVAAGTVVNIDNIGGTGTITSNLGTASFSSSANRGLSNGDEIVYAFVGDGPTSPTAFLTAIANDVFTVSGGTLAGTGLTAGVNAIQFSAVDSGADIAAFTGSRGDQTSFADYVAIINDPENWITQDATGDQSIDGAAPDVPFSTTAFTVDTDTPPPTGNEIGGINILDEAASLQGATGTPTATNAIELVRLGSFAAAPGGNAEVVSFDPTSDQLYILNTFGNKIDIVRIGADGSLTQTGTIDLTTLTEYGGANSVAVKNGIVAVGYANVTASDNGYVALFNAAGALQNTIEVGVLPDMLTFTPDGTKILVANEGETVAVDNNPVGGISIINVAGGAASASATNTISFGSLTGNETALEQAGLALFPGQAAGTDVEPEYIAIAPDGTRAYVTLQEVNAVAVIDLTDPSADRPVSILPLGMIDRSLIGNEFDGSDRDGAGSAGRIAIQNHPVFSLLQPDAIASFAVAGKTYFITANEGDARVVFTSEEIRVSANGYNLDDAVFPNEAELKSDDVIGRLNAIAHEGDTDGDGDYDQIVTYGGRGISIFEQNADGTIIKVRETGGEFEKILSTLPNANTLFNGENLDGSFDTRSDNKGPEPEGVSVGVVNGRTYAFVTLERAGGVMVYDVTNPAAASFVSYEPPLPFSSGTPVPADNAPETVITISAADSPMGVALVVTANEVGNATTVYAAITTIPTIQGTGQASTLAGQQVTTMGVVTAVDTNGSRGFYIQDPNGDGNSGTSDGIFVFTNAAPTITVGQMVSVTGLVAEFTPNGAAAGAFSTTQITATSAAGGVINVLGDGVDITPVTIGGVGGLLPPSTSLADASAFYESLEGMLVTVKEAVVVGPSNSFGEIYTVVDNDADRSNGVNASELNGRGALPIEGGTDDFGNTDVTGGDFNPERLQIDDDNGVLAGFVTPAANVGAQLGDVTGVVNYDFGNYQVVATEAFTVEQASTITKEVTTIVGSADRLTVASYNAENLDPTDGQARFNLIAQEILVNLGTPDIIALQEVQDNDGPGSAGGSSVKAANVTLQTLVDALNAAAPAGVQYEFIDNPFIGDDSNGGEPGGNIRNAFVYRTDRVDFVEDSLRTVASDGTAISDVAGNGDQQSNVENAFFASRPPLVASFEFNGQEVTIVNNHFTSKGGSGALYGSDATPLNAGEVQRAAQAQAVNNFVDSLLGTDPDAKIMVAGDLNDFEFEQPLDVIKGTASISNYDVPGSDAIAATATYTPGGEAILFDLLETLPADERTDYVFEGNAQTLDHVLVTAGLQDGASFDVVRINAEFSDQTSDHDPLVAGFDIPAVEENFTLQLLHLADGEAGLLASTTAKNLAALVDAFDDDYANTLILSGGDNWLPGPFLAGGTDLSVTPVLNAVTGSTIAANANIPIAAVDIAIHNSIGVEVSSIGNHEFDLGSRVFRDSFTPGSVAGWVGANFVHVSANLDFSGDADLNPRFTNTLDGGTGTLVAEAASLKGRIAPATVVTKGGEKIGIVGATTQILEAISSPSGTEVKGFPTGAGPNGEVDNMALLAAQLQPIIDELIAEGVNKIILQAHLQQIGNEQALAALLRGVDIILAAGSNTRLGDADDEAEAFPGHAAQFQGDYPLQVTGADGKTTLIVNTDNEYTYLGRLAIEFDENGDIVLDSITQNQPINGAYASTAENVAEAWGTTVDNLANTAFADGTKGDKVERLTDAVQNVINVKDANVFGFTDVYLEGERQFVRTQETNLGNLSADANGFVAREALGEEPIIVSLKNGGGIRAQIGTLSAPDPVDGSVDKLPPPANPDTGKPDGGVSQLDVENSLRFNNKLMVFDTTAQGLLNLLNWGAGLAPNNGGFPQIGGVRFSFDPDLPGNSGTTPGSRVRDVALIDENDNIMVRLVDDGVVLADVPSVISVVALNFTANGGDGYPTKANGSNFRYLLNDGTVSAPIDEALDFTAPANVPTNTLGEQQAFAEYMQEFHATDATAYNEADTAIALDTRIQNLNVRDDTVLIGSRDGDENDNVIRGTQLNDTIEGNGGNDQIDGRGGDDTLNGGDGLDVLVGGSGNDRLNGGVGADIMDGGAGDDIFFVDDAGDQVIESGDNGVDTVNSSVSHVLGAKVENLILTGTAAIDGAGTRLDNVLTGNAGVNTLSGLEGNDTLDGGAGADMMLGDAGDDIYVVDNAGDQVFEKGSDGADTVNSSISYMLDVKVENLTLIGDADISGTGTRLGNTITGNAGDNRLDGLRGSDMLTGGDGADTFVFSTAVNVIINVDTITDFQVGVDTIQLSDRIFSGLARGELDASAFTIGASATDAADRIIYDNTNGALSFDADGNGAGAAVQFATLGTSLALTNTDFLVV